MNPVLMLTHNNLELTKRAINSVLAQKIKTTYPADLFVIDNGSTDGSQDWLSGHYAFRERTQWHNFLGNNDGVSSGWNRGLGWLFGNPFFIVDYVLVINNDVVLPPWFYRQLLEYDKPFVSGVSVDKMEQIAQPAPMGELSIHPDFSAFLIRREAWETVGPFDESMKLYAGDCDWHVQAERAGVKLYGAHVPFYHERSSTLNLAPPEERAEIEAQANRDRQRFFEKWGCSPWGAGYDALFQ